MSDLHETVEKAIRETLKDEHGAGSDLNSVREDRTGPWVYVEGNLDVQHLASHVIETLELGDYEYAIERTVLSGELGPVIVGEYWHTREDVNEKLLDLTSDRVSYRMVKRRKAGPAEDA